jgi:hypothetical protein
MRNRIIIVAFIFSIFSGSSVSAEVINISKEKSMSQKCQVSNSLLKCDETILLEAQNCPVRGTNPDESNYSTWGYIGSFFAIGVLVPTTVYLIR